MCFELDSVPPIPTRSGGAPARSEDLVLEAALTAAGVEHELVVSEGSPPSFFDRRYEEYADASANAWERVLAVIARDSPSGS